MKKKMILKADFICLMTQMMRHLNYADITAELYIRYG